MTLMQRIQRAGQSVEPEWQDRDVERVWQGLKRKRRRRAVAAAAGVTSAAVIAVLALFVVPGRHGGVDPVVQSTNATSGTLRFADGSIAVSWGGSAGSLAVSCRRRLSLLTGLPEAPAGEQLSLPLDDGDSLEDARHVRNAIARFGQVEGVSDAERGEAWKRIQAAARKFGVDLQEHSWREL